MLGITIPDAIAVGTLIAAVLAGWFGKKSGEALLKTKPLDPVAAGIAAGFVDKDLMQRLVIATEAVAATLKEIVGIQTDEHDHATQQKLDLIAAAVLKKNDDDARASRTVDRVTDRVTGRKPRD